MAKKLLKSAKSSVRIIAGEYRRRLVEFIEADGLRPTPDRVRETLFNWLQDDIVNQRVLDCCAGSGVLGFEALSRGAATVIMLEPNATQYQQLLTTQQQLQISSNKLSIINATAQQAIEQLPPQSAFGVIFLDPPYALNLWQELLQCLINKQLIDVNTLVYIEADRPHPQILGEKLIDITVIKEKKMGQIYCGIYQITS